MNDRIPIPRLFLLLLALMAFAILAAPSADAQSIQPREQLR